MATDLVKEVLEDIRSPLYRNAIYLLLNTLLVAGAGILFWVIVARLYPDEAQVGQALILIGIVAFVATLAQLGFGVGLIRFLPRSRRDKGRLVSTCLTISALVALALSAVLLLTLDVWFPGGQDPLSVALLVPIFLLLAVFGVSNPIVDNTFVAGRRASYIVVRGGLYQAVRLVMLFLLVGFLGVLGILASILFAQFLALALAFALLLPRLYPGFRLLPIVDRALVGDILPFSLGNHVAEVLYVLPYPVILVLIPRLTGSVEQAAFFAMPWLIASILFAVPLMASVSLYAEGSHFQERLRGDLRRTLRFILPLLALGILSLWFWGDWILALFGPSYAVEGLGLLKLLAVSAIFVAVNVLFVSVARVMKWVRAVVALWAYVALGTIALSFLLLPELGLEGVGYAWLITNGTAAVAVTAAYLLKRGSIRSLLTASAKA